MKYSSVVLTSAKFFTRNWVVYNDHTTFAPLVEPWPTHKLFIHGRNFGIGQNLFSKLQMSSTRKQQVNRRKHEQPLNEVGD